MNGRTVRVGVVGASGYTGRELLGLVSRHPRLRLEFATSESSAGESVPGGGGVRYVGLEAARLDGADLVFCCLPTGRSGEWALRAHEAGARVIDLSGDLRDGTGGATYGLPELWRQSVVAADLVANPGCYPTGGLIALAPAVRNALLDAGRPVVIDAASGVTGAGRTPKPELLFGEVAEDYRAYGAGNVHRHVPEIGRGLAALADSAPPFVFTPHLLPVRRGILETIYVPTIDRVDAREAAELWGAAYEDEPFVECLWDGSLPSLRRAAGRNVVCIGFASVPVDPPILVLVAALDNLLKGAAGQAVQNANLMFGWPEAEGLPL